MDTKMAVEQVVGIYTIVLHPDADADAFTKFMTQERSLSWTSSRIGEQISDGLYQCLGVDSERRYIWLVTISRGNFVNMNFQVSRRHIEDEYNRFSEKLAAFGETVQRQILLEPATVATAE